MTTTVHAATTTPTAAHPGPAGNHRFPLVHESGRKPLHHKTNGDGPDQPAAVTTPHRRQAAEVVDKRTPRMSLGAAWNGAIGAYAHFATLGLLSDLVVDTLATGIREAA